MVTFQEIIATLLKDELTLIIVQDLLRREANKSRGGIPLIFVLLVAFVGIILGYLLKKT